MLKALEAIKMSAHQQNSQAQNYAFFMGILLELFVLWFVSIKTIAPSSPAPASTPAPAPA